MRKVICSGKYRQLNSIYFHLVVNSKSATQGQVGNKQEHMNKQTQMQQNGTTARNENKTACLSAGGNWTPWRSTDSDSSSSDTHTGTQNNNNNNNKNNKKKTI